MSFGRPDPCGPARPADYATSADYLEDLLAVVADRRATANFARRDAARAARDRSPALARAFDAWSLSLEERVLVGCALAVELSPELSARIGVLTATSAAALLGVPIWALSDRLGALDRLAIFSFSEGPFHARVLRPAERLRQLIADEVELDSTLSWIRRVTAEPSLGFRQLAPALQNQLKNFAERDRREAPIALVIGAPGLAPERYACDAAVAAGGAVLLVDGAALSSDRRIAELAREALLLGATIVLAGAAGDTAIARLRDLPLPLVIAARHRCEPAPPPPLSRVELDCPDGPGRLRLWKAALGEAADPRVLADVAAIHAVASPAVDDAVRLAGPWPTLDELRKALATSLPVLTRSANAGVSWDDLVVPGSVGQRIVELIDRVRLRATVACARDGVIGVLTGPPGTGKSLAAALIAHELGLEPLELSAGSASFGAELASAHGLMMVVIDGLDARACRQLWPRLERFPGVVLLMAHDDLPCAAAVQVHFPMPDAHARAQLWAQLLPPSLRSLSASLARPEGLSGGRIRELVERAQLLAAAAGESLSLRWLQLIIARAS